MNFCSRAALAAGEAAAGTAVGADAYVFLPVPKGLWGDNELNGEWAPPETLAAIRAARPGRVVTRLYNPARGAADAAALVCTAPDLPRPEALKPLLAVVAARWRVDPAPGPRLAVCTHGTRDRCCAKWGFAVYNLARRLFDEGRSPFEPMECSHLGGDRFAATGIFFPSGSMYAHLDDLDLAALTAAEAGGELMASWYRGRVFEPALAQVVRAGLAREGLCRAAAERLTLTGMDDGRMLAEIAGQAFAVSTSTAEFDFYPSCSKMAKARPSRARRSVYVEAEAIGTP